jgi:hypothetical protein
MFPETSVDTQWTTRRHIPEDNTLRNALSGKIQSFLILKHVVNIVCTVISMVILIGRPACSCKRPGGKCLEARQLTYMLLFRCNGPELRIIALSAI